MSSTDHALRCLHAGMRGLFLAGGLCLAPVQVFAAGGLCESAGLPAATCTEPDVGVWDTWRSIINNKPGPPKSSEAAAIEDATATLGKTYPCGFTYAVNDAPYAESGKILSWTAKEDSPRVLYAGFVSGANGNCQATTPEASGTVIIRRERRVRCPRGYGWQMADDKPTVCIKD